MHYLVDPQVDFQPSSADKGQCGAQRWRSSRGGGGHLPVPGGRPGADLLRHRPHQAAAERPRRVGWGHASCKSLNEFTHRYTHSHQGHKSNQTVTVQLWQNKSKSGQFHIKLRMKIALENTRKSMLLISAPYIYFFKSAFLLGTQYCVCKFSKLGSIYVYFSSVSLTPNCASPSSYLNRFKNR